MNRSPGTAPAQHLRCHESSSLEKPPSAATTNPMSVSQAQRPSAFNSDLSNNEQRLSLSYKRAATVSESSLPDRGVVAAVDEHDGRGQLRSSPPRREAAVGSSSDNKNRISIYTSGLTPSHTHSQDNTTSPRTTQGASSPSAKPPSSTPPPTSKTTNGLATQSPLPKSATKAPTGGIRRVTTEGPNWAQKFHISVPASAMTDSENNNEPTDTQNVGTQRRQSYAITAGRQFETKPNYEKGDAMRQALQEDSRPERSVSRGRSHMDKSIEATVKKPEASGHHRSRKASHMMNIFDSQTEGKRSITRGQEADQPSSDVSSIISRPLSPDSPSSTVSQDITRQDTTPVDYFGKGRLDTSTIYQTEEPGEISPRAPDQSSTAIYDDFREDKSHPRLPANLLQEIRDTKLVRPIALRNKASTPGVPTIEEDDLLDESKKEVPEAHDDEEEHIAAAVYYPHEGPAAEEIEGFEVHDNILGEPHLEEDSVSSKSKPVIQAQESKDIQVPHEERIDISVESDYEKSILHGTLKTKDTIIEDDASRTPRIPAADKIAVYKPPISSSESDFESSDELSQPDDGLTTPTARSPKEGRMRAGTVAKPKNAVTLAPYKHQVGGHSTIFRFSRRAVCKQLNNRENEFYERIERTHPDMLKFLPRYIGVLNVTFSKGPKQDQSGNSTDEQGLKPPVEPSRESSISDSEVNSSMSNAQHVARQPGVEVTPHPRIVSHSQQLGPIPQVLLNQNRHILPSEYFGLPERPKSADPTHFRQRGRDFSNGRSLLSSELTNEKDTPSPVRPAPPEHSPSWGTTSVNVPLKDKVLREVFGPPPIIHKKRHAHAHNTIPLRKGSESRRRGNMSLQVYDHGGTTTARQPRRSHSVHQSDTLSNGTTNTEQDPESSILGKEYSSSTSRYDDLKYDLEKVKTTGSASTDASDEGSRPGFRRRHSGMGLRRRRRSVSGDEKPNLEYFEDEALSTMKEAEVFAMDEEQKQSTDSGTNQETVTETLSATVEQDPSSETTKLVLANATDGIENGIQEVVSTEPLPVNPKDAQSSSTDQRVAYFILLEDLTAGMGRPCVLDLKMGTRQYGVEANEKKIKSQRDKCQMTTSQELGVRICGMQTFNRKTEKSAYEDKYFGRNVKAGRQFREALMRFLYDGVSVKSVERHIPTILHKISKLESMVRRLPGYRFYASSLLMYYDAEPEQSRDLLEAEKNGIDFIKQRKEEGKPWPPPIEIKLVDFANCVTAEDPILDDAKAPPAFPKDIDRGYLRGLKSLKRSFERILDDIQNGRYFECIEGEQAGRLKEKWNSSYEDRGAEVIPEAEDEGEVSF